MRLRLISLLVVIAAAVPAVALASHSAKSLKFEAYLTGGKSESPKGPAKGKGTANITITGTKVCWKFSKVSGIDKVTASHIHAGKAGKSGNVVVAFFAGPLKMTGCVASNAATVKAIAKNPAAFYVNIHTVRYPAGAIRGQLHAGD